MNKLFGWLFPRSLVGRVFALYAVSLLGFVGVGFGVFMRYQFTHELDSAHRRNQATLFRACQK